MKSSTIWVLIATEKFASISANADGVSTALQEHHNDATPDKDAEHSRCGFACALMLELCRGALDRAYDGLIIVADPVMLGELHKIMTRNVAALLIAELTEPPAFLSQLASQPAPQSRAQA
jgi:protein required for attachment to host cells